MLSEVSGFIAIKGERLLSIATISQILELPAWQKDRPNKSGGSRSVWFYKTEESACLSERSIDDCLAELLERPVMNAEKFRALPKNTIIEVVITIFSDDDRPSLEISADNVRSLSLLGANLRLAGYFGKED